MAKEYFHFFTGIDIIENQVPAEAFGPVPGNVNTHFLVTSLHKRITGGTENPKAFAICDGTVVVREVPGSSPAQLTMIVKPTQKLPVELPRIKFIIYRGILKSSLIKNASGNDVILENTDADANDLTMRMQQSHLDRGGAGQLVDDAIQAYDTPLPPGTVGDVKLFRSFNAQDGVVDPNLDRPNQAPDIKSGEYIAQFHPGGFGIEIIMENVGFEPDINYAEQLSHVVQAPAAGATQKSAWQHWEKKEEILNFIDPCAFFGSLPDENVKVKKNNNTYISGDTNIYEHILEGRSATNTPLQLFQNRNKVYLDIRNNLNYSYDYFRDYLHGGGTPWDIRLAFDSSTALNSFAQVEYRNYQSYNWPLLTLTTAQLILPSDPNADESLICLSFPKGGDFDADENEAPIFFLSFGEFKRKKFLEKKKSFVYPKFAGLASTYTDSINLKLSNYVSAGSSVPISRYILAKYLKQYSRCDAPPSGDTVIRSTEFLDNIFRPFAMEVKDPNSTTNFQLRVYENEIHLDALGFTGQSHMSHSGIARDAAGTVTLFVYATSDKFVNSDKSANQPFAVTTMDQQAPTMTFFQMIASTFGACVDASTVPVAVPPMGPTPQVINLVLPAQPNQLNRYNRDDLQFIQLTAGQYATLQGFLQDGAGNNVFVTPNSEVHLGLEFRQTVLDLTAQTFVEYELVLRGYADAVDALGNPIPNQVEVRDVPTGIYYYRRSQRVRLESRLLERRGYKVNNTGVTVTVNEPDQTSQTTPTKYELISTIYLVKGWNLSNAEFCQYKTYVEQNIQEIWNTDNNWGIGSLFYNANTNIAPVLRNNPGDPPSPAGYFTRSHYIDATNIQVKVATARQYDVLKDGECMFMVTKGTARSVTYGDRKLGELVYQTNKRDGTPNNPDDPYEDPVQNIPAHEFGHIMGLNDYYSYLAQLYGTGDLHLFDVAGNSWGVAVLRYCRNEDGEIFDENYGVRFNWFHNLMSSQKKVPTQAISDSRPRSNTLTYRSYMHYYRPTNPVTGLANKQTVFVTPKQLDFIVNRDEQEDLPQYAYLRKELDLAPTGAQFLFDGTFVGAASLAVFDPNHDQINQVTFTLPQKRIFTDDHFRLFFQDDANFNKYEHNMDYRCLRNPEDADPNNPGNPTPDAPNFIRSIRGFINPFIENPKANSDELNMLAQTDITELRVLNRFHQLDRGNLSPGQHLMWDIQTGGVVFNHITVQGVEACLNWLNFPNMPQQLLIQAAPPMMAVPIDPGMPNTNTLTNWLNAGNQNNQRLGLNAAKIFVNAVWWANRTARANQNAYERTLLGLFGNPGGPNISHSFRHFSLSKDNPNNALDPYRKVGKDNDSGPYEVAACGRLVWNYAIENAPGHADPNDPLYVNGGALLERGNGNYASTQMRDAGGGTVGTFFLNYHFYPNRKLIFDLIENACLGGGCTLAGNYD